MKKILLVEDNSANRLLFSRIFSSLGYICICASDGQRALHTLEDNPEIACVFSDCQMPILDGPGLAQELRQRRGAKFPILLYSSFLSAKELEELKRKGASAVLSYPLTPALVKKHLTHYLSDT